MEKLFHYFVVIDSDGLYLKGRLNGYKNSWTNDIKEAKFFLKKKHAITQISFWYRTYPQKGLPILKPIDIQLDYNSIIYGNQIDVEAKVAYNNNRILEFKLNRN